MGGKPKWTLLQRHTDGQKAHEKMLNTTNYQRNASQHYNEASPHLVRMDIIKKSTNSTCWRECGEREPSYTADGNVNWYSHQGEKYGGFLKKLTIELPHDLAIPLLAMCWSGYMHPNVHRNTIYNSQELERIEMSINR